MGNKQGGTTNVDGTDGSLRAKDAKTKEDKKREKEEKQKRKREKKEKEKQRMRGKYQDDFEFDDSSHITGGEDSESGVFHSAENVSVSPYLDSCTISQLEPMGGAAGSSSWSSSGGSRLHHEQHHHQFQHPKILSSSRDFRDGFSLEACIPPEIARPERYHTSVSSAAEGGVGGAGAAASSTYSSQLDRNKDGSGKSRRSNASSSGSRHVTPAASRSQKETSAGMDGDGYSTPLLSTPVFSRAHRDRHSPTMASSYTPYTDPDASMDISAFPSKTSYNIFSHPFFHKGSHRKDHQHQEQSRQPSDHPLFPDYRNLPKPTSPHPQRRALSPKMTTTPFKIISSDDSSSSPTTPTPQRRAANLFNFLRSGGSRKGKDKDLQGTGEKNRQPHGQSASKDWQQAEDLDSEVFSSVSLKEANEKRKPPWKTWERSTVPKKTSEKAKRLSIFATSRKTGKNKKERRSSQGVDIVRPSSAAELSSRDRTPSSLSTSTCSPLADISEATAANSPIVASKSTLQEAKAQTDPPSQKPPAPQTSASSSSLRRRIKQAVAGNKHSRTSSRGSDSNLDSKTITPSASGGINNGTFNRASSSPPTTKSAAFCIMRLEELERAIERTIREKFPDAEPFILRKPGMATKEEEIKGSRSLPTTPSLKKKRYRSRDDAEGDSGGSSCQSRNGETSYSNENGNGGVVLSGPSGNGTARISTAGNGKDSRSDSSKNYDVTYDSVPSPTMSPVILRRFGARTRHASISPKVPRAKTAALYNSPSEMPKLEEPFESSSVATPAYSKPYKVSGLAITVTSGSATPTTSSGVRKISSPMPFSSVPQGDNNSGTTSALTVTPLSRCKVASASNSDVATVAMKPLSPAHKSNSKYDNVMDDEEVPHYAAMIHATGKTQKAYVIRESGNNRETVTSKSQKTSGSGHRLVRQHRAEEEGDYDNLTRISQTKVCQQEPQSDRSKGKRFDTKTETGPFKSDEVGGGDLDSDEEQEGPLLSGGDEKKARETKQRRVIVPTFSAVFGSVSPKLKRHNFSEKDGTEDSDTMKDRKSDKPMATMEAVKDGQPIQKYLMQSNTKHAESEKSSNVTVFTAPHVSSHSKVKSQNSSKFINVETPLHPNGKTFTNTKQNLSHIPGNNRSGDKQAPVKSMSFDSSMQSAHPKENIGLSHKQELTESFTSKPSYYSINPSEGNIHLAQKFPSSSKQDVCKTSSKTTVEAVSALSVRERVRSLNKSASEGWSHPSSPSSPPPNISPSHVSTGHVIMGPQPYPHFVPERTGKPVSTSGGSVKQLSLRSQGSATISSLPQSSVSTQRSQHPVTRTGGPFLSHHRPGYGIQSAKTLGLTSPGSARKHSTDHVVFGSAVALPCRVYAQVTTPTTSPTAVSPTSPSVPVLYSPTSPSVMRRQDEKKHAYLVKKHSPSAHARNVSSTQDYGSARYVSTRDQVQNVGSAGERGLEAEREKAETGSNVTPHTAEFSVRIPSDFNTRRDVKPVLTTSVQHKEDSESSSIKNRTSTQKAFIYEGEANLKASSPPVSVSASKVRTDSSHSSSSSGKCVTPVVQDSSGCINVKTQKVKGVTVTQPDVKTQPEPLYSYRQNVGAQSQSSVENIKHKISHKGQTKEEKSDNVKDDDAATSRRMLLQLDQLSGREQRRKEAFGQQEKYKEESEKRKQLHEDNASIEDENIESPAVYKPSLRYVEQDAKPLQRQPLSKVISDMISISNQVAHQPVQPCEVEEQSAQQTQQTQQQQIQKQSQQHVQGLQQQPQRQRRRRQQPPEHHQQKQIFSSQAGQQQSLDCLKQPNQEQETAHGSKQNPPRQQVQQKQQPSAVSVEQEQEQAKSSAAAGKSTPLSRSIDPIGLESEATKTAQDVSFQIPPGHRVMCQSREMQTDIVTKADKAVDSWTLPLNDPALALRRDGAVGNGNEAAGNGSILKQQLPKDETAHTQGYEEERKKKSSKSDSDSDFLNKIKSLPAVPPVQKVTSKTKRGITFEEAAGEISGDQPGSEVPPPSPTAMELLMQEMDEEDSDEDENERKEIEQAMRRESEMKDFTDKIYKRLSDLLGSHSGGDDGDGDSDDDENLQERSASLMKNEPEHIDEDENGVFESDSGPSRKARNVGNITPAALYEQNIQLPREGNDSEEGISDDEVPDSSFVGSAGLMASSIHKDDEQPSQASSYRSVPPRVLTIESSSSLTTTTESESEVEEAPVIIFKSPPSQQSTELRRLRDYREDPELPTLLRNAIISRNMGADLWDEDERKPQSPVVEEVFDRAIEQNVFVFPERSVECQEQYLPGRDRTSVDQVQQEKIALDTKSHLKPPLQSLQQRRSSREYHSDDDVVAGRGVPDYYDDATLWVTRRQQRPPVQFSQLSLAVVAQRRRERRERWLKKRRRNRTELVSSTGGSSDTDREYPTPRGYKGSGKVGGEQTISQTVSRQPTSQQRRHFLSGSSLDAYEDYSEDKDGRDESKPYDMGSGILVSPKYTKPIVPAFLGGGGLEKWETDGAREQHEHGNKSSAYISDERLRHTQGGHYHEGSETCDKSQRKDREELDADDGEEHKMAVAGAIIRPHLDEGPFLTTRTQPQCHSGIPGIEETFNELKSVQNILEGLQDRKISLDTGNTAVPKTKPPPSPSLPALTKENVRSLRDYDKTGGSRRSRMSLTDRTESDLDLYSERGRDDGSNSGSEYADDEGEEDNGEDEETCYNTAEDDLDGGGADSRRPHSGLTSSDTSTNRKSGDLSDDSEKDFVVSCTFYNSNVCPPELANSGGGIAPLPSGVSSARFGSVTSSPAFGPNNQAMMSTSTPAFGSTGPSLFYDNRHPYPQQPQWQRQPLPNLTGGGTASEGATSTHGSTFQSARHQMHDIQTHLQALRRQMEVLPDDEDDDVTPRSMTTSCPGLTVYRKYQ